jgi:HK97 family phage prohead protease
MNEYEARSSDLWEEVRFEMLAEGNGLTMDGPMALYGKASRLLSEVDLAGSQQARSQLARLGGRTFREVIDPGAFARSLNAAPDIVLHYQHDERTLPLGRTKAGTLRLTESADQVRSQADLPDNEWGRPVRDAVLRGDIGGISFRMGKIKDSWSRERLADGYDGPVRHLHEIQLRREISLVTFPGYDTPATVREMAEAIAAEPDELDAAFRVLRVPDGKLTDEQHELLQKAIATRVEAPYISPAEMTKLALMRDRLGPKPEDAPAG